MMINEQLIQIQRLDIIGDSGSHYICMDCKWDGEITECDFDTEYDEFKGIYKRYPVCPKCGGGLDC